MRLGLIGYGAIAHIALDTLASHLRAPLDAIVVLARKDGIARAQRMLESFGAQGAALRRVVGDIESLQAEAPDLVLEAAGHGAVRAYGVQVLAEGCDLVVTSTGVLADDALRADLEHAAAQSGARMIVSPGAVGGLDILAAARLSGLEEVTYISRKPPEAWRGTPAEQACDLAALREATTFYEGAAAGAARAYPQNANVAATIAMAGVGFAKTRVRLIADPGVARNVHEIVVRSACADFTMRIEGHASPDNPKTSTTTGYSLARIVLDRLGAHRQET